MREIKFRAWDVNASKMLEAWQLSICEKRVFVQKVKFGDGEPRNVILMQFTGIFDKNGTEIYEGDVVVSKGYGVGVVEWKDGSLGVEGMSFGEHENEHSTNIDSWEVIGDIYQNPELIN